MTEKQLEKGVELACDIKNARKYLTNLSEIGASRKYETNYISANINTHSLKLHIKSGTLDKILNIIKEDVDNRLNDLEAEFKKL